MEIVAVLRRPQKFCLSWVVASTMVELLFVVYYTKLLRSGQPLHAIEAYVLSDVVTRKVLKQN